MIARWRVRPLAKSGMGPNHLTTVSLTLVTGAAAFRFVQADPVECAL